MLLLNGNAPDQSTGFEDFSINFIGKELFYFKSNPKKRSGMSLEYGHFRHETLEGLSSHPKVSGQIVVIDQLMLDDLLARPTDYIESAASGCLAFAYRKEESARFLFERLGTESSSGISGTYQ